MSYTILKFVVFPDIVYEKGQQLPLLGNHINNVWENSKFIFSIELYL